MKRINIDLKHFFCTSILLISIFGCKKESPAEEVISPNTKLLTQKLWYFQGAVSNISIDWDNNGLFDTNITNQMKNCEKDNTYSFNKDGNGSVNESFDKCNITDPQSYTVNWKFLANETKITINSVEHEIIRLDELALVTKHSMVKNGQNFMMTTYYYHL